MFYGKWYKIVENVSQNMGKSSMKKEFDNNPVYGDKCIKTKIKWYEDKIKKIF